MPVDCLPMAKDGQRSPATALPESVENCSQKRAKYPSGVYRPTCLVLVLPLGHQINFFRALAEDPPSRVR